MSIKLRKEIDKKNAEMKIIVPIEEQVWKKEQEISFNKLAKKTKVPGFRPGKAPINKLKEYISTANIWEDAVSKLLNVAVKEAVKEITDKDIVLDSPTYAVEKISENELEITFIYPIMPEMEIKNYKDLKIKFNQPTEKEIKEDAEEQIDKLLSRGAILLPREGEGAKVHKNDTITFDFKGFIDGKEFDGGEAEGFTLKIGSKQFIPGFEEQLIDKPLNWSGDIKVKFPSDYYKEDFRDKEAKFEIKIHEIKYEDKPALNEEYIKSLAIQNVTNEEEFNNYMIDLSKRELIEKARMKFIDELMQKVIDENEIPVPRTIALKELQALLKKFKENLKQQKINEKEYFEITGYNEQKVKDELLLEANKSIKKSLLFSYFAKDLNIKPTEEDFERQYQRIAKLYHIASDMVKQMVQKNVIEPQIINELVTDRLIELNNPGVKIEKEKVELPPKKWRKIKKWW